MVGVVFSGGELCGGAVATELATSLGVNQGERQRPELRLLDHSEGSWTDHSSREGKVSVDGEMT